MLRTGVAAIARHCGHAPTRVVAFHQNLGRELSRKHVRKY